MTISKKNRIYIKKIYYYMIYIIITKILLKVEKQKQITFYMTKYNIFYIQKL